MYLAGFGMLSIALGATQTCPVYDPAGFPGQYRWVQTQLDGEEQQRAEVTEDAQRSAKARLLAELSPGLTPLAQIRLSREIQTRDLGWLPQRGRAGIACAAAIVSSEYLLSLQQEEAALAGEIFQLARGVVATGRSCPAAAGKAVYVAPPRTVDGFLAGSLGSTLAARLRGALTEAGVPVTSADDPGAARLVVELDPRDSKGVGVVAVLEAPGTRTSCGEGASFAVNPVLLVEDVDTALAELQGIVVGTWHTDREGRRVGGGGLTASAVLSDSDGNLCERDRNTLLVTTSAPSRVQVYDLRPDGMGWKLLPSRGTWTVVTPSLPLSMTFDAAPLPTPGNEHFLVVAAPPEGDVGAVGAFDGTCKLANALSEADIPASAALQLVRFRVDRAGSAACPTSRPVVLSSAPVPQCGTGVLVAP